MHGVTTSECEVSGGDGGGAWCVSVGVGVGRGVVCVGVSVLRVCEEASVHFPHTCRLGASKEGEIIEDDISTKVHHGAMNKIENVMSIYFGFGLGSCT